MIMPSPRAVVVVDVRNVEQVRRFIQRVSELRGRATEYAIQLGATPEGRCVSQLSDDLELALCELEIDSQDVG